MDWTVKFKPWNSSNASIQMVDTPFLRYATRKSNSTISMIMHFLFGTILVVRSVQNKWSQSEANFMKNAIFFASVAFIHFNRKHTVHSSLCEIIYGKYVKLSPQLYDCKTSLFFTTWIFFVCLLTKVLHNFSKADVSSFVEISIIKIRSFCYHT